MHFFAVIVPCYNSKKTIKRTIDSFDKQSFKDFEVVFIDDCSTDGTVLEINQCIQGSQFESRLILNGTNLGPSKSREKGIRVADSRYVCFCDADDEYRSDYLEEMFKALKGGECDIAFCNHVKVLSTKKIKKNRPINVLSGLSKKQLIAMSSDSMCCLAAKKEIVSSVVFPDIRNGEDMAIIPVIIQKSSSFGFSNEYIYKYYCVKSSLSKKYSDTIFQHLESSFKFILDNLDSAFFEEKEFLGIRNYLYAYLLIAFKNKVPRKEIKNTIKRFNSLFPNWEKNVYLKSLPSYKRIILKSAKKSFFLVCSILCKLHGFVTKG